MLKTAQKRAEDENASEFMATLARWWSDKYTLPANHALFVSRPPRELILEMLEDLFEQRATMKRRVPKLTGRERHEAVETLHELEKFLGVAQDLDGPILTGDPIADEWERQIARGELPDFMRETKPAKLKVVKGG